MGFTDRLQHAWNAFLGRDPTKLTGSNYGPATSLYPGRPKLTRGNARSMVTSIINRIAVDVASIDVQHVYLDDAGRYIEPVNSYLNECLTVSANLDQTARDFMENVVFTLLDDGTVAIVPVDTTVDATRNNAFDIQTLRAGRVVQWYPKHVKINVYNENTGKRQDILMPKQSVAIVQNPFFQIMNEPNSYYQRLLDKIRMLDTIDAESASGKLNMIIQLPYTIKSEARREQAEARRKDMEMQLSTSKYGVAYTDATEKVTQINRALDNNLFNQVEFYMKQWLAQLGLPMTVFDGTADEAAMLNYQTRTLEPIISAITDEMKRKFLTKTARTKGQSIMFFKDPFSLVPVNQIADIADKFTRNEILTSNEVRQIIGFKPSDDPKADQLVNANMPMADTGMEGFGEEEATEEVPEE